MAYACSYDVPSTIEMYDEVNKLIGDEPAPGMMAHLVVRSDSGLRHVEVWKSEADWRRFREERVLPAVHEVLRAAGLTEMPAEPFMEELELVDLRLGLLPH